MNAAIDVDLTSPSQLCREIKFYGGHGGRMALAKAIARKFIEVSDRIRSLEAEVNRVKKERDNACSQLEKIGRKAFWASRSTLDES